MKYRVEVDVQFNAEANAIAFCNLVEEIKDKVTTEDFGNGPDFENYFRCRYHPCSHDEKPPKPCGDYVNVNFKKVEKDEHVNSDGKVVTYNVIDVTTKESISAVGK